MSLDDIVVASAKKFLETYGANRPGKVHADYSVFYLLEVSREESVFSHEELLEIEKGYPLPSRVYELKLRKGKSIPMGVKALWELQASGMGFPFRASSGLFGELNRFASAVYLTGSISGSHYYPVIVYPAAASRFFGEVEPQDFMGRLFPKLSMTIKPSCNSEVGRVVNASPEFIPSDNACALGRFAYAMGVPNTAKIEQGETFLPYLVEIREAMRSGSLDENYMRQASGFFYDFFSLLYVARGYVQPSGPRKNVVVFSLPSSRDRTVSERLGSQLSVFLEGVLKVDVMSRWIDRVEVKGRGVYGFAPRVPVYKAEFVDALARLGVYAGR